MRQVRDTPSKCGSPSAQGDPFALFLIELGLEAYSCTPAALHGKMTSCRPSYGSYCCVTWCQNNGRTQKKPGTCFFRIPRDSRSAAWVTYSRRADLMEKPASVLYNSYRMCSDHFTAQDFMDPGHTRLTKKAVPTVYPDSLDVSPTQVFVVTSPQSTVPEDHLEKAICIISLSEDPAVQGYSHPVDDEQASEDVVEETCEKSSLVAASHVAKGSLQVMSGCNTSLSELDAADSQVDLSGSSSIGAECYAVHDGMSTSASSFIDKAASSGGDLPVAFNGLARGSPSKKFRTTIQRLQSKVASYRRTIARLRKQQSKLLPSISKALEIIRPCVTEEVFKLLCAHMQLQEKGNGKRFPAWVRKFALHLYFRGPRAYEYLAPIFSLPTPRSLRRWISNLGDEQV
ncbi:uncharacterized protein LOC142580030 isoform X2 [Dermacentor variabilis]|uniref:uncharacterized protein LOC142580030 isoform X2 n=1 Tax=Dermacentor variabilis TaxID=34621 RepID=UPI003F5C9B69